MALSIRINPAVWTTISPFKEVPESARGRVIITIKDNSFDHANVPLVPNPMGKHMVDGFPFVTGQTNNSTLNINMAPIAVDELFLKKTAASMGGTLINQLARVVSEGTVLVQTSAGVALTATDLLNLAF